MVAVAIRLIAGSGDTWSVELDGLGQPVTGTLEGLKQALEAADKLNDKDKPGRSNRDFAYTFGKVRIKVTGGSSAELSLATLVDLPGVLCVTDGSGVRLRSLKEIEQDLRALAAYGELQATTMQKEAQAQLRAELARLRDEFRRHLGQQTLTFTSTFFSITDVFAASGAATLSLAVDTEALYAAIESSLGNGQPTGRELLRAELDAGVNFTFTDGLGTLQGRAHLACVVTDDGKIENAIGLLAGLDLPEFPKLPRFHFDPPRIPFSRLSLPDLDLGNLVNLVDLRLPSLTTGSPVRIDWSPAGRVPVVKIANSPTLTWSIDASALTGTLKVQPKGGSEVDLATITGLKLAADSGHYQIEGIINSSGSAQQGIEIADTDAGSRVPLDITITGASARIALVGQWNLANPASATLRADATIEVPRLVISSRQDPRVRLVLAATWDATAEVGGQPAGRLSRLEILEPSRVELIVGAVTVTIEGVMRLVGVIQLHEKISAPKEVPSLPNLFVVERIGELLAAALQWAMGQAGYGTGNAGTLLTGLAEPLIEAMGKVLDLASQASDAALSHMVIEARLDAGSYALRQLLITPVKWQGGTPKEKSRLQFQGLDLTVPTAWSPSLLLDFSGPAFAALIVNPADGELVLETDLWLKRGGAPDEAIRDTHQNGQRPHQRLIKLTLAPTAGAPIALVAFDAGDLRLFQAIENSVTTGETIELLSAQVSATILTAHRRPVLKPIEFGSSLKGTITFNADGAERLLPFFGTPGTGGSEHVKLKKVSEAKLEGSEARIPLTLEITLDDLQTEVDLDLTLDLSRMTAKISGGETLVIKGKEKQGDLFGLTYAIRAKPGAEVQDKKFKQFQLDLSGGNPRLVLHSDAIFELFYARLGTEGRGLIFKVQELAVAKGLFDLVAEVDPDEPVTLPGVGMPFRFRDGKLVVRRGKIQSFYISGTGQLPPELVGEANCTVKLMLGRGSDGRLAVLACDAELDKTDDPIRCPGTRFTLTIAKLGLAMENFGGDGGYQFYFQVTGTLVFTPAGGELADSFLKNLKNAKLSLIKAPLGRDMRLLLRAIDLQITLDPQATIKLFDVFSFDLRGFGFYPQSNAFGSPPTPALSISGQARFLESGDVISAKIDFHKMWIAPPEQGQALPRVRFDGLGLSLSLKGAGTIEGTAVTVDGNLPTLFKPDTLPANITAQGFLASGRLRIEGWASMSAAMGFLELSRPGEGGRRHAFFLYAQQNELSEPIPTPFKEIYLREVGFGFGYRYTLAGLRRADAVATPQALVQVLDEVSKYQNDLDNFSVWEPEASGDRITLAMRGMFSVMSASPSGTLSPQEEKLDNPLLFDFVAALRSDLTLMITARAWPSLNYFNWARAKNRAEFEHNPLLRGYLYLSAPRQELLARLVSDPQGYIGETPKLSPEIVNAFKSVRWSSTLYMRPGLVHFEYGWPYELEIRLPEREDFGLVCQGGMVMRIEDQSLLYGIAFRATGFAKFGGDAGGKSLGASVSARADFSLDGKLIAYLSVERPGDTLFYGSLAFACTVDFQVRVWLELDLLIKTLHCEANFALRLSISVALELAVGPGLLAGRGQASLAVSAFGRTLSISAGFGFDTDKLADARARVDRFLALGLDAAVPDPASALGLDAAVPDPASALTPSAPPTPAAPPQPSDGNLDDNTKRHEQLSDINNGNPPAPSGSGSSVEITVEGDAIAAPRFWAMLFELSAQPGTFVLQLVPRDRTASGLIIDNLDENDSTFFGLPPANDADKNAYEIDISGTATLTLLQASEKPQELKAGKHSLKLMASQAVATGNGAELKLGALLEQAFLRENVTLGPDGKIQSRQGNLLQPRAEPVEPVGKRAGFDAEAVRRDLRQAATDMAKLSFSRSQWRATEELRSSIIGTVCASAERIAREAWVDASRNPVWSGRKPPSQGMSIDARDLGLTFVVTPPPDDDSLGGLFGPAGPGPRQSTFTIAVLNKEGIPVVTKDKDGKDILAPGEVTPGHRTVHLYNPPSRFFDRQHPRLARLAWQARPAGMALDWDLEPAWGSSNGVWNDPEFHLKHYRIQRVFKTVNGVFDVIKPFETTFKAASPLKAKLEGGNIVWEHTRPLAQFIDDFADLPEAWRAGLRQQGVRTEQGFQEASTSWNVLKTIGLASDKALRVSYTVIPVDIAGREGMGTPIDTVIHAPAQPPMAIVRAELAIVYKHLPGAGAKSGNKAFEGLRLRIDDPVCNEPADWEDREQPQRLPWVGTRYVLKIRRERSLPIGLFGADAVDAALHRPGAQELGRQDTDDHTFDLILHWPGQWRDSVSDAGEDKDKARLYRREMALRQGNLGADTRDSRTPWFEVTRGGANAFDALVAALGIDESGNQTQPNSVRVGIQRLDRGTEPVPPNSRVPATVPSPSPWLAVDTLLWVGQAGADASGRPTPRPIETVVETFESPCVTGYAPLAFADLAGEAGRLLVHYPAPGRTLGQLLSQDEGEAKNSLKRLRDGERRVGTRIRWNAVPNSGAKASTGGSGSTPPVANHRPAFIAGYDLFEIDLTGAAETDDLIAVARDVARAQTLDPRLASGLPAGIDDFGAVEAFYPSETLRLQGDKAGARRHAWFSLAESLCAWPQPMVRRSLGLTANDADLAPLFEWGGPQMIVIYWEDISKKGSLACLNELGGAPGFAWVSADKLSSDGRTGIENAPAGAVAFKPKDINPAKPEEETWTAADLRRLMFGLVQGPAAGDDWAKSGLANNFRQNAGQKDGMDKYRGLALVIEGRHGKGTTGKVRLTVHLDQPLHPVLADAIDMLAWQDDAAEGGSEPFYRRYRPVLDPAPATEAKSIIELLRERPAGRDPYGWAVLRTLGLAQGLRLYDTLRGDFLPPRKVLDWVNQVLELSLLRYQGIEMGAPMVEILTNPDGLYTLASFDGGTPPLTGKAVEDIVGKQVLGLVQLSLRPLAERLKQPEAPGLARYFSVESSSANKLDIDMGKITSVNPKSPFLVDLIDLSSGLSAGRIITLAREKDETARTRLAGGREARSQIKIESTGQGTLPLALLRVIAPGLKDDAEIKAALTEAGAAPKPVKLPRLLDSRNFECFERFPELDDNAVADVVAVVKGMNKDKGPQSFDDFRWYAERCFPTDPSTHPTNPDEAVEAIAAPWADLTRRFLEHGPAGKPDPTGVAFALATIPRPEPWRVRLQSDGTMDILLVHKDRLARRRRYLVRPFGRYENLIAACHASREGDAGPNALPWVARRELQDSFLPPEDRKLEIGAILPQIDASELRYHSVDIVVPRTEPLAPPVILSAGRLDVGAETDRRPGRLVEVVVARHQEEIASEANSMTADRLQFEHTAFGFWREFAHPLWAVALESIGQKADASFLIDALPKIEPTEPVPAPKLSFGSATSLNEVEELDPKKFGRLRTSLPERITDGWRGISVVRTQGVPHFYRTYVAAFAAAGVVVSKPVAAIIPEGHHELHWPWEEHGEATAINNRPMWSIERDDTANPPTIRVVFSLPPIRYLDGIPFADRLLWWPEADPDRRVFRLPDPGVVYELSTRAVPAGSGDLAVALAADSSPEAELFALPKEATDSKTYAVKSSGARLKIDPAVDLKLAVATGIWDLTMTLKVRPGQEVPTPVATDLNSLLGAAGDFKLDAADWAGLAPFAPIGQIVINITRPDPDTTVIPPTIDWSPFVKEVTEVLDQLRPYQGRASAALPAVQALESLIAELKKFEDIGSVLAPETREERWIALVGGSPPFGNKFVALSMKIPAGLPNLPDKPANASVSVQKPPSGWALDAPKNCSFRPRASFMVAMDKKAKPRSGNADDAARIRSGFTLPLFAALWSLDRRDAAAADRKPFDNIAPVATEIPEDLRRDGLALKVAKGLHVKGIASFEWIVAVGLDIKPSIDAREGALGGALGNLIDFLEKTEAAYPKHSGLGCFPTLEALAVIEREGSGSISLRLPWAVSQDAGWDPLLRGLEAAGSVVTRNADPMALILRRPPSEPEMTMLKTLIPGLSDSPPKVEAVKLWERIAELTADQVFGTRRRPFVKAFKGLLDPLHHALRRTTEV